MKRSRPGIASADRPRRGPFASLLDQILRDRTALDGLAFAYAGLAASERHALVRAVLQDAADPTRALGVLLAVEEEPRARQRLAGLLGRHGRVQQSAFLTGSDAHGEARLLQSLPSLEPELMSIAWKESKIESIQINSPSDFKADDTVPTVPVSEAVETLAPLLWRHIRAGRQLPEGVERFAAFFSLPSSP